MPLNILLLTRNEIIDDKIRYSHLVILIITFIYLNVLNYSHTILTKNSNKLNNILLNALNNNLKEMNINIANNNKYYQNKYYSENIFTSLGDLFNNEIAILNKIKYGICNSDFR